MWVQASRLYQDKRGRLSLQKKRTGLRKRAREKLSVPQKGKIPAFAGMTGVGKSQEFKETGCAGMTEERFLPPQE